MEVDQVGPFFPLFDLPAELRQLISSCLPRDNLRLFAKTCRTAASDTRDLRLLPLLLYYVAHATPVSLDQSEKTSLAAEVVLELHPDLLFKRGLTKGSAGHNIEGSAWQIAWAMGDVSMLKMMMALIPNIKEGVDIAIAQYAEQFPDGSRLDERNKKLLAQLDEDLKEIVSAISDEPHNGRLPKPKTEAAFQRFKSHLAPKENELICTGMYCPPDILKRIYEVVSQYLHVWNNRVRHSAWGLIWNDTIVRDNNKFLLYAHHVIGFAQRVATAAVDAQRYKQGLQYYDNEKTAPNRTESYFYEVNLFCTWKNNFFL